MNKENIEEYLKKAHIPLSKEFVTTNILFSFFANLALTFFFKNLIETVISSILFVIYAFILIRNKRYLNEYYNSLLVKSWLYGYIFWLLLIFSILLQIYFEIVFWYFILELIILIICAIYIKKRLYSTFKKFEFKINFTGFGKNYIPIAITAYLSVHLFLVFFKPPFVKNVAWYLLSSVFFLITILFEAIFVSDVTLYFAYVKYCDSKNI